MNELDFPKSNILIVDDEKEHAQVMCEALERLGHRCDVTYSLGQARSRLDQRHYDVVVTDLVMEGKRDGLEMLDASKALHPAPPVCWSPPTPTSRRVKRP